MLTKVTWILVLLWKSEQIMPRSNLRQPDLTTLGRKVLLNLSGGGCSSACVFPFTYWGVTYNSCTSDDHDRPWCATATAMSGDVTTWVNCDEDCPTGACKIYRGRYIVAGNNAVASTSKADLQECANWCPEIPACRAWTFNSDEMRCWLKLSDGEKGCLDGACEKGVLSTLMSPWVSGTKSCGATGVIAPVGGGITKPMGPVDFVCPGTTACDCISPSTSCDMCHVDCTADCNDLTMDSTSKCFSELACDPGLLLELDTGLTCPVGSLSPICPGDGICDCISPSSSCSKCEVECHADCNDLTQDSITSKCFSEFACDKTLLLEVDNAHCTDKSMPPPPIGGTRICECLKSSESEDCTTCEVNCEADCNDLVGESGKCFSDFACGKGLLFEIGD